MISNHFSDDGRHFYAVLLRFQIRDNLISVVFMTYPAIRENDSRLSKIILL